MDPIRIDEIMGRDRYEARRTEVRRRLVEHKRDRRVAVGERLSLVFEDRATVWYQTQEMIWVEQIADLDAIREELAVYNALVPGAGELSATLLIEVPVREQAADELARLIGIDEHVSLAVDDTIRVPARFEEGRQTAEKLSAVQYVRFPLDPDAQARLVAGAPITVRVNHPNYEAHVVLPERVRASLAADLSAVDGGETALTWVRDG